LSAEGSDATPRELTRLRQLPQCRPVSPTNNTMKPFIAIPAIAALVYRAWSHKSLTPIGILTAIVVAVVHAIHPWSVFFALLAVFFLAGNAATKVCTSM
jgi:uncharacterized membrane protein